MRMPERAPGLVQVEVGDETLVYDPSTHRCHRLNAPAATVLAGCDGRAFGEVPLDEGLLRAGLARLQAAGLLAPGPPWRRPSRRGFLKGVVLPAVLTVAVPPAAWAQSASGCVACAGSPLCPNCPDSADGQCLPCDAPPGCSQCMCMTSYQTTGTSCLDDALVDTLCILMTGAPAFVHPDCATARANAAASVVYLTCNGPGLNFTPTPGYVCCSCTPP